MKKIIVYDTETTGLPVWSSPSEDPCQPRVIQLAAEVCNEETGEVLAAMNFIIRPDGWTIPDDLATLTGISTEKAYDVGLPMEFVLPMFIDMWDLADQRVAHNESFDMRMVRIELMRHAKYGSEFADKWKAAPAYCTQVNSTKICNLPPTAKMLAAKRNHPKSPNLAEAYKHFTGNDLEGAHNAMVDIMACKAVYYGIKKLTETAKAA